jgi:mono/diheme cytochrome c family protein
MKTMHRRQGVVGGLMIIGLAVAIALAGCAQESEMPTSDPTATGPGAPPSPPATPPGQVLDVVTLYGQHCSGCHGQRGEGGTGPDLRALEDDDRDEIARQIREGGGDMPAFEQRLTDTEIEALAEHVREFE